MRTVLPFAAPLIALLGCNPDAGDSADTSAGDTDPIDTAPTDLDGDGSPEGVDCDDADPAVQTPNTWFADDDLDGLGRDGSETTACAVAPSGSAPVGGDCDDADAAIGAVRGWYLDDDEDGLGFGELLPEVTACDPGPGYAAVNGDCVDTDPTIGAVRVWFNDYDGDGRGAGLPAEGVTACDPGEGYSEYDDDCDDSDEIVLNARVWYVDGDGDGYGAGEPDPTQTGCEAPLGFSVEAGDCADGEATRFPFAPEVCGDGIVQDCDGTVAEATRQCRYTNRHLPQAEAFLAGSGTGNDGLSSSLSVGDLNGDGEIDLAVGHMDYAAGSGATYVYFGPLGATAAAPDRTLLGPDGAHFGSSVGIVPDLTGDGAADLVVGAEFENTGSGGDGSARVFSGTLLATQTPPATATLTGLGFYAYTGGGGRVMVVDDPGLAPVVLVGSTRARADAGAVSVVTGEVSGARPIGEFPRIEGGGDNAGGGLGYDGGDLDGDGVVDVVSGAFRASGERGQVAIHHGPIIGLHEFDEDATLLLTGPVSAQIGSAVRVADLDGDDTPEVIVGAWGAGAVWIVDDLSAGTADIDARRRARLTGTGTVGWSLTDPLDLDADGDLDIVAGLNTGGLYIAWGPFTEDRAAGVDAAQMSADDIAGHVLSDVTERDGQQGFFLGGQHSGGAVFWLGATSY